VKSISDVRNVFAYELFSALDKLGRTVESTTEVIKILVERIERGSIFGFIDINLES